MLSQKLLQLATAIAADDLDLGTPCRPSHLVPYTHSVQEVEPGHYQRRVAETRTLLK